MYNMLVTPFAIVCTRISKNTPMTLASRIEPLFPLHKSTHKSTHNKQTIFVGVKQLCYNFFGIHTEEILLKRRLWPTTKHTNAWRRLDTTANQSTIKIQQLHLQICVSKFKPQHKKNNRNRASYLSLKATTSGTSGLTKSLLVFLTFCKVAFFALNNNPHKLHITNK